MGAGLYGVGTEGWNSHELLVVTVVWLALLLANVGLAAAIYSAHCRFSRCLEQERQKEIRASMISTTVRELHMAPPESVGLSFTDVSYDAPNGNRILTRLTGFVNPGEMVALMGPSGAGKTTALDVLAGRRTDGTISGSMYINGRSLSQSRDYFKDRTGYMLQLAEAYSVCLTVKENLAYAALLRLPARLSFEERMQRVDAVIAVRARPQPRSTSAARAAALRSVRRVPGRSCGSSGSRTSAWARRRAVASRAGRSAS
jgi:ABC-type transport system involved in cytochrome bd biosynthesis fused ATPase/permease subunit